MKRARILSVIMILFQCVFAQSDSTTTSFGTPVFETIDYPGATATRAYGINNSGRIVGSYDSSHGPTTHAFLSYQGEMHVVDPPNSHGWAEAYVINNQGEVVGSNDYHGKQAGFLFRSGHYQHIAFVDVSGAEGINEGGLIVGFFGHDFRQLHGYLYNPGNQRITRIDYPGALLTTASAINDSNVIVGIWVDSSERRHGYVKDGSAITSMDFPGASETFLASINSAGDMAGFYDDDAGLRHGFVRSNDQFRTLDYPGAISTEISCINDVGLIVGDYTDSNGTQHGFVAHL
ncbi:MAG TPA: hypothetical protein VH437_08805 [Terriglobales bacterium]